MAGMMEKFKNFLTGGEYEEDYAEYDDDMGIYEEQDEAEDTSMWTGNSYEEQTVISEPAPAVTTPVYQQPAVLNNSASPDHSDRGHPLSDSILKPFVKNLLISIPD